MRTPASGCPRPVFSWLVPAAAIVLVPLLPPAPGSAQLISPGRLSSPHSELEGIRSCTRCHELGKPGVSAARCLACHEPLARRIREGTGLHAGYSDDCASCHREHFGEEFDLVRLDTLAFRHDTVGYALEGAHGDLACGTCHTASMVSDPEVRAFREEHGALRRTYLGLPTECASCHAADDPHGPQFEARACTGCHDARSWEGAPSFDHASSRYPLTGRHASLDCGSCHPSERDPALGSTVRYAPVAHGACTACHVDEHDGAMEGRCESCHSTAGWIPVDPARVRDRFDHRRTGFALEGSHASAPCAACHDPGATPPPGVRLTFPETSRHGAFPAPVATACASCHVDVHEGALADAPGGGECAGCHGQDAWLPADYGIARHNREARFLLEGAHRAVACEACHRPGGEALVLEPPVDGCVTCHVADDPHRGQFVDRRCEECHTVSSFRIDAFDHAGTRFPLDGAHADVSCAACHPTERSGGTDPFVRYLPLGTRCADCHGESR